MTLDHDLMSHSLDSLLVSSMSADSALMANASQQVLRSPFGTSTADSADGTGGAVASPACDYSFETGIRELHSCTTVVDVADESPRAKRARAVVYTASVSDQSEGEIRRQQHTTWTQVLPCCLDRSTNVTMIPALLQHC